MVFKTPKASTGAPTRSTVVRSVTPASGSTQPVSVPVTLTRPPETIAAHAGPTALRSRSGFSSPVRVFLPMGGEPKQAGSVVVTSGSLSEEMSLRFAVRFVAGLRQEIAPKLNQVAQSYDLRQEMHLTKVSTGVAVTNLNSSWSNTQSTVHATSTFAMTPGRPVLVAVMTATASLTTMSGFGVAWARTTGVSLNGVGSLSVWTGEVAVATSGSLSLHNDGVLVGPRAAWSVVELVGADTASLIVQSAVSTGNSSAPGVSLAPFASTAGLSFGVIGQRSSGIPITSGAGFTQIFNVSSNLTGGRMQNQHANNDTGIDWGSTAAVNWGAIGLEVRPA